MRNSFETTIEVGHNELEIDIEYDYYPFRVGDRGPYGEPTSPDEPASAEIIDLKIIDPGTRKKSEGSFLLPLAGATFLAELEEEALRHANTDYD